MDDFSNNQGNTGINAPVFNESGKNEQKALSDAGQALDIARKLEWQDMDRDIRRARVLAAFNGAAPFSDSDLVNKAQGYRYNVSFGWMEGVVGRALVPYNDLTIDIANLTEIKAELPEEKKKILQLEFGTIMDEWGQWPKRVSRLNQDLVLNGYNVFIFPTDYDPFPIFVEQKAGYVDEGAPNDVNELELFVWKKSYLIHELYARIADEETAKKAGWNVDNVRKSLMAAQPESLGRSNVDQSGYWSQIQSLIRGGALWSSIVGAKKIMTYHVFASELDGSVTHYIVLNENYSDRADGSELFKREKRFPSMKEFLVYFDLETGNGTWHGSKGLGQRAFNTHKAIDKIRCSIMDQAFVSGLTLLQPGDQLSQEELTLSVIGPFAVIPAGLTIASNVLPSVANTTFQVDNLLTATSEQRIGDVVPNAQSTIANQDKTATQAKIDASRSLAITQGNLKRYVDPISQTISIIVKRLLKENSPDEYAKRFQKRLLEKGFTTDDFKKINGARNTGKIADVIGETANKTQILFQEFRNDPDVDQHVLKEKRIASVLDADAAKELLISPEDKTRTIEAQRQQEMEVTTMEGGKPVQVSARDPHEDHLKYIFQDAGAKIQAAAHNFNPQVIAVLQNELQHAAQHLSFLAQDKTKKNILKQYEDGVKTLAQGIKDLQKQASQLAKHALDHAASIAQTPEEQAQVDAAKAKLQNPEASQAPGATQTPQPTLTT